MRNKKKKSMKANQKTHGSSKRPSTRHLPKLEKELQEIEAPVEHEDEVDELNFTH